MKGLVGTVGIGCSSRGKVMNWTTIGANLRREPMMHLTLVALRPSARMPHCEVPCAVDQSAIISHDLVHCFVHHLSSVQVSLVRLTHVSVRCGLGMFWRRIKTRSLKLYTVPIVAADINLELTSYDRQGGWVASPETGMRPFVTAHLDLTTEAPDIQLIV